MRGQTPIAPVIYYKNNIYDLYLNEGMMERQLSSIFAVVEEVVE